MSTQTNLTFEEDYDSDDFKASNKVSFDLRKQVFTVTRRTMAQLQADAEEARNNPNRMTTFEDWFKSHLSDKDFERFWKVVNTENNPVRFATLKKIIAAVEAELNAVGDDEDTPKD